MDMYDETVQSVKSTTRQTVDFIKRFDEYIEKHIKNGKFPKALNDGQLADIKKNSLTGQITDLNACQKGLNKSILDSLPPDIKEAFLKNFERAEKQGLISIDFDKKTINLTDKGKEYIKNPEFQKALATNTAKLKDCEVTKIGVELTGTDKDLLFFKNEKVMNLKAIDFSKASPEMREKFATNLKRWNKNGLVKLSKDPSSLKITLSEKGQKLISSPLFAEKFGADSLSEKALSAVPQGKLVIALKQFATAVTNTTKTAKGAVNSTQNVGG